MSSINQNMFRFILIRFADRGLVWNGQLHIELFKVGVGIGILLSNTAALSVNKEQL